MKRKLLITSLLVLSFVLGTIASGLNDFFTDKPSYNIEEVVLISRSPQWKYDLGFYVAVVLVEETENGFDVHCKVHVGDHNYFENIPLGTVTTKEEAYSTWGAITWTNDALTIGSSKETQVTVKRSKIEQHR